MSAYKHLMKLLAYLLLLISSSGVVAQQLDAEISALQKQYEQAKPHEMSPLLNKLMVRRDRLINENPGHPDEIFWRLAQLEDAMLKASRFNGLEYRVRYGLPDKTEVVQLEKMTRVALEQSETIIRELPGLLSESSKDSVLTDRLMAIRNNRLPYLRGMALVIAADQGIMPSASSARQEAIRLLGSDAMQLRPSERVNASRYLAEAHAGEQQLDVASQILDRQLQARPEMDFDTLGLLLAGYEIRALNDPGNAAARGQLRAATTGTASHRLLLIEQAARHWMEASRQALADQDDPDRLAAHAELERSAFESFLLLLPEQGGMEVPDDPTMVYRLIEQRHGRLKVRDYKADHVPVSVVLSQLVPMLDDPERVPEAHEMLVSIVDRKGLMPRVQTRLLALTMRAEALMGRHAQAVDHAIKWSTIATDREEAFTAAGMAAAMSTEALKLSPGSTQLQSAKQRSITHLLQNFPDHPDIDQWLLESGVMADQDGDRTKALEFYEMIDGESVARVQSISRKARGLSVELVHSPVLPGDLDKARKQLDGYYSENRVLARKFPREASLARVDLNLLAAQIELMRSNPTKALEYLGRIQAHAIDPAQAKRVYGLKLDSAIETKRVGAVDAIVLEIPADLKADMLSNRLVKRLLEPGPRLPLDPLVDPENRELLLYLTEALADSLPTSQYHQAAIMEGYRRIGEPEKAIEFSSRVLAENPDLGTAIFSRAESLLMIPGTDRAEAIRLYTRLSKLDPADEPNLFWTSQLRLLQLMQEDGRSMDAIEARLNRLQRQYPDLGGMPYIGEFAIVRSGLNDPILP